MSENVLTRVVGWLRAGYPEGMPASDHVALLEVLARRLTAEETLQVASALVAERGLPVSNEQIAEAIQQMRLTPAAEEDVARVAAHLEAGGWPSAAEDGEGGGPLVSPASA